jgi:tetrahydromethanopterin S-methyltransferase subunit F
MDTAPSIPDIRDRAQFIGRTQHAAKTLIGIEKGRS